MIFMVSKNFQHLVINVILKARQMSAAAEIDADFDARYVSFFNRADIDGWEIRKVPVCLPKRLNAKG
jgi:Cytochrome c oxidase subunit Va